MNLIWVDWAILVIVLISALISLTRGFFKEVLSLVTWVAAVIVAWLFSGSLSLMFQDMIETPSVRHSAAAGVLFVATLITGGLVNSLIGKLVQITGLSGTDRALGMIFGALRGVLLVTMLVGVAEYLPVHQDNWWTTSTLVPHFEIVSEWVKAFAMGFLGNLFVQ